MKDILFTVEHNKKITDNLFELKLVSGEKLPEMKCGQFVNLQLADKTKPLRRPFCLYKYDEFSITIIVMIAGEGTKQLSTIMAGKQMQVILPLGNGWTLTDEHKKIALIGGGVGGAPLLGVTQEYKGKEYRTFLGFGSKEQMALVEDFEDACETLISTDDGSFGFKGYVSELFMSEYDKGYRPDVILVCGTHAMIKSIAKISYDKKIAAYMSGESHMACGVGACLVCACAMKGKNGEVVNKRACADGPIFSLEDIIL